MERVDTVNDAYLSDWEHCGTGCRVKTICSTYKPLDERLRAASKQYVKVALGRQADVSEATSEIEMGRHGLHL